MVRTGGRAVARYEAAALDAAALQAAERGDHVLLEARFRGSTRWEAYLAPLIDQLRDGDLATVRVAAVRARAAFGPQDSIRDVVSLEATSPFRDSLDQVLREVARLDHDA